MATTSDRSDRGRSRTEPVLTVTRYDLITAGMIAAVTALVITVVALIVVWLTNRIPEPPRPTHVELLVIPGGSPDGAPDETLKVDSPEDVTDDPSVAQEPSEEIQLQEMLENVMEVSDEASQIAQQQYATASETTGNPGRAEGTGRRPLGLGNGEGGFPREQRWILKFADEGSLESYARQLDFFKIELGAIMPDGRLIYLSNVSRSPPNKRVTRTGSGENRLYMSWQGNTDDRREADIALYRAAGVPDAGKALILHFYEPETEAMMIQLEKEFANRPIAQIRKTFFSVQGSGGGFRFVVTRQKYLR